MTAAHLLRDELKRLLPWHQARIDCLAHLIVAMIEVRTVNLTQLALAFEVSVKQASAYQRVKRFFRQEVLETDRAAMLVTQQSGLAADSQGGGMGTESPFDLADFQPLEGVTDGGIGRCPTPLTVEGAVEALPMGSDKLVNLAIGGRPSPFKVPWT